MGKLMLGSYVKVKSAWENYVDNKKGSQSLEWIGIAAVIVIVVGVVSQAFDGDKQFGKDIVKKFSDMISAIGSGE